jgi:hypothetical protein
MARLVFTMVVFYLALWLIPGKFMFRRPSVVFYSKVTANSLLDPQAIFLKRAHPVVLGDFPHR